MTISKAWNVAQAITAFPCAEPDPVIYLLTFGPSVAPALLEWISFGCRDLLKFKLGKGVPCGRAMKANVAKVIPPKYQDLVGGIMKWEHRFSYAGQMFLLADLIDETLARWTTLAYQMSDCPDAQDIANWQVIYSAPETLAPMVPTVIGGSVVNSTGHLGIGWPTGAVVPSGWYCNLSFDVSARSLFSGESISLDTWIRVDTAPKYDYPSNHYAPGYPGQDKTGHYLAHLHVPEDKPSQVYTFYAMSNEYALTTEFNAYGAASKLPISDWSMNPLGCIRDLTTERHPDPAGRNPRSKYPTKFARWLAENAPKPAHGPPGGKPRSKK